MSETVARTFIKPLYFKRKLVISLVLVIIFVVTIEIWVANRLSTFGEKISGLESTKYSLQLENNYLKNQIAQKKSLKSNEKKSQKLGFVKIKNLEFIKNDAISLNSDKL